jgi:hypothetical protein
LHRIAKHLTSRLNLSHGGNHMFKELVVEQVTSQPRRNVSHAIAVTSCQKFKIAQVILNVIKREKFAYGCMSSIYVRLAAAFEFKNT